MQIKRGEHIQWFVRYHEGDLEPQQRLLVEAFLLINPDLQPEFDQLQEVKLKNKGEGLQWNSLKKPEVPLNQEDRNLFLARALENELSNEELQSFNLSLQNDEALKKEWALMQLCRLIPENAYVAKSDLYCSSGLDVPQFILDSDSINAIRLTPRVDVRYESKASLKKIAPLAQPKVIDLKFLRYAASIAAILVIAWILIPDSAEVANEIKLVQNSSFERELNLRQNGDSELVVPVTNSITQSPAKIQQASNAQNNMAETVKYLEVEKIEKRHLNQIDSEIGTPALALAMNQVGTGLNKQAAQPALSNTQGYLSLADFAKLQMTKTLTGEENPESGLVYATLDQAAKKISEKSGTPVELKLRDNKKQNRDFNIRIGKFGISHTSASRP